MRADASTRPAFTDAVVATVLDALPRRPRPRVIGLSGVPGSGKTTLAHALAEAARRRGVATCVLSLDDFYLGRRERARLAREVHPLLATRGVPGTHDIGLLHGVLAALPRASHARPVHVPRFDKGRDTRLPPSRWRCVAHPVELVILEGWCVGLPAQRGAALRNAVNVLERDEDRDRHWRRHVNARLSDPYARLWRALDALVLLQAPGWDVVAAWRAEQERPLLRAGSPNAMPDEALRRFLQHFERLGRHALRALPARAHVRLVLGADRSVRAIR